MLLAVNDRIFAKTTGQKFQLVYQKLVIPPSVTKTFQRCVFGKRTTMSLNETNRVCRQLYIRSAMGGAFVMNCRDGYIILISSEFLTEEQHNEWNSPKFNRRISNDY